MAVSTTTSPLSYQSNSRPIWLLCCAMYPSRDIEAEETTLPMSSTFPLTLSACRMGLSHVYGRPLGPLAVSQVANRRKRRQHHLMTIDLFAGIPARDDRAAAA
jgi:hypothetical protein